MSVKQFFRVRRMGADVDGDGLDWAVETFLLGTDPDATDAPTNLTAHGQLLGIDLAWQAGSAATVSGYLVERRESMAADGPFTAWHELTRPTGFFSNCAEHCITIMGHLLHAGLRVPADAAIIAGWDDEFLHYAVPTFAHYRIDGAKIGRRAAAMLLDLIRHGSGKICSVQIVPEFVRGETI